MKEFLLVVLGGALTFLASYVVESVKFGRDKRERKEAFRLRMELELQSAAELLEKLKSSLEYKNLFEFGKIRSAEKQASTLEELKKDISVMSSSIQSKFLALVLGYSSFLQEVNGMEVFATSEFEKLTKNTVSVFKTKQEFDSHFENLRLQKLVQLVDLKRKIDDLIRAL